MKVSAKKTDVQFKYNDIVYSTFDSLDKVLCSKVENIKISHPQCIDSIFILMQPSGELDNIDSFYTWRVHKYKIGILFHPSQHELLVMRSAHRKIKICNNLYPIYFNCIDNIFGVPEVLKNKPLPSDKLLKKFDVFPDDYIEFDMVNKTIIRFGQ